MLPLHQDAQQASKGLTSHAGLWYDRFFNCYNEQGEVPADDKQKNIRGKKAWIDTVTQSPVGDKAALEAVINKQKSIAEAYGGSTLVMTTDWHFVTGLGNNHPVENGFAWHHTLGVPYLTGAAVKGMVRAWCEVWKEFDEEKSQKWFGDTKQSGELIFFDAIPTKQVQLKADIMTPHYGKWYAEGGTRPNQPDTTPADWHNPVLVPFLVVGKGASFQFAVGKRKGSNIDLSEAIQALSDALEWIGAGAKTAVGYGRFSEDRQARTARERAIKAQQEAEQQARKLTEQESRRASMSPLQADLDRWASSNPEPNTVAQWLDGIDTRSREEQLQIAEVLKAYYEGRGSWQKPSKKQKANVQRIKGILR